MFEEAAVGADEEKEGRFLDGEDTLNEEETDRTLDNFAKFFLCLLPARCSWKQGTPSHGMTNSTFCLRVE